MSDTIKVTKNRGRATLETKFSAKPVHTAVVGGSRASSQRPSTGAEIRLFAKSKAPTAFVTETRLATHR